MHTSGDHSFVVQWKFRALCSFLNPSSYIIFVPCKLMGSIYPDFVDRRAK